jgi:hypothetical protein
MHHACLWDEVLTAVARNIAQPSVPRYLRSAEGQKIFSSLAKFQRGLCLYQRRKH